MFIRRNYIDSIREGLALEVAEELERWEKWMVQEGPENSHFYHSSGGDGLGHIGPACSEFEQWMFDTGFAWLQTYTGKKLNWTHRPTATRWGPGDHIRAHRDMGVEVPSWTCVINLSRDWESDWGGHLFTRNPETEEWECTPVVFDQLTMFYSREHYVSQVAPHAERGRYAITTWLMNQEESHLYPVVDGGKTRKPPGY